MRPGWLFFCFLSFFCISLGPLLYAPSILWAALSCFFHDRYIVLLLIQERKKRWWLGILGRRIPPNSVIQTISSSFYVIVPAFFCFLFSIEIIELPGHFFISETKDVL